MVFKSGTWHGKYYAEKAAGACVPRAPAQLPHFSATWAGTQRKTEVGRGGRRGKSWGRWQRLLGVRSQAGRGHSTAGTLTQERPLWGLEGCLFVVCFTGTFSFTEEKMKEKAPTARRPLVPLSHCLGGIRAPMQSWGPGTDPEGLPDPSSAHGQGSPDLGAVPSPGPRRRSPSSGKALRKGPQQVWPAGGLALTTPAFGTRGPETHRPHRWPPRHPPPAIRLDLFSFGLKRPGHRMQPVGRLWAPPLTLRIVRARGGQGGTERRAGAARPQAPHQRALHLRPQHPSSPSPPLHPRTLTLAPPDPATPGPAPLEPAPPPGPARTHLGRPRRRPLRSG